MKSLIRKARCCAPAKKAAEAELSLPAKSEQAQCCAKVSKNVAGCHD